jgi:deoxyribodipyrimidine photolyase
VVVEAKTGSGGREKPTDKGSTSSPATKRGRQDSRSRPAKKWFTNGGAQGLTAQLRKNKAELQDRAACAWEDLKRACDNYRTLDKEYRAAKTRWETDRTRLAADKTTAEAEAAENRVEADKAVEASREARHQLTELQTRLKQVTREHEELLARTGLGRVTEKRWSHTSSLSLMKSRDGGEMPAIASRMVDSSWPTIPVILRY